MKTSPTELSLRSLRAGGWMVDVVERWVPGHGGMPGKRRDLFGMIDLVAVKGRLTLGVQTTSAGNVSSRVEKMMDDEHAERLAALRAAGWLLVVHGWRKTTIPTRAGAKGGQACQHPSGSRCSCIWTLHREIDLS